MDGVDGIRHAVREQVKYGADWIKYYSDRRYFLKDGALHSWVNFTDEEAKAIVEEAHRLGRKVAAHAMGREGILSALNAGVDTIEHGDGLDEETMDLMVKRGVYWCPTIFVGVYVAEGRAKAGAPIWVTMVDLEKQAFAKALRKGVKIAYGTDAGGYAWTETQAREFDVHGALRHDAAAGDRVGHPRGRRAAGSRGGHRHGGSRPIRRHHRRGGRPAQGHRGARARALRDEGRADGALGQA